MHVLEANISGNADLVLYVISYDGQICQRSENYDEYLEASDGKGGDRVKQRVLDRPNTVDTAKS